MTLQQELNKLYRSGTLSRLVKAGVMSATPIFYLEIYNAYQQGFTMRELAKKFNTTATTVHRAITTIKNTTTP